MKKIVVLGAAGMVGQNLVPMLVQKNYRIVAIDKHKKNLQLLKYLNPSIEAIRTDLADKDWENLVEGSQAVVDLKAQIASKKKQAFWKNNVQAQKNIIEACEKYEIKHIIHASSSVVISVANDNYTETKRECEKLVRESNIPSTILRPTLMYGCFDVKHIGWIMKLLDYIPILPLPGHGRYIRQPVFVVDFCRIILSCIKKGATKKIHNIIGFEKIFFVNMIKTGLRTRGMFRILLPLPISLFNFIVKVYSILLRKPVVTSDQLSALIAGDEFETEDWPNEFGVTYTPVKEGLRKVCRAPCYKYRKSMTNAH